jgi:hypothetical protein
MFFFVNTVKFAISALMPGWNRSGACATCGWCAAAATARRAGFFLASTPQTSVCAPRWRYCRWGRATTLRGAWAGVEVRAVGCRLIAGYQGEDLGKLLLGYQDAAVVDLDRWHLTFSQTVLGVWRLAWLTSRRRATPSR